VAADFKQKESSLKKKKTEAEKEPSKMGGGWLVWAWW